MLRLMFLFGLFLSLASPGMAQSTSRIQALIVAVCGTAPNSGYVVGTLQFVTMDPNGQLCPGTSGGGGGSVTQGTTPWVDDITQWGNVNVLAGAGATGTGSPRTTQAQDTTTIAGSAPGTAGTPSTNVVSVQGVTNGTPVITVSSPGARTIVTLDVKTVTTGGTAVTALTSGHKSAGGWIQNPNVATVNLCINEISTAAGSTSSGDTTCIQPGQTYYLTASTGAVSVISSDSSHPFSGYGLQ